MLRLLPKIEVANVVASQRKAQIDEGVNLAKKIDTLRETLSSLQSQHALFLSGVERELREKTDGLFQKIAGLEIEIKALEEKRSLALAPLDEKITEIESRKAELELFQVSLEEKLQKLDQRERIQDKRDQLSNQLKASANSRDRESAKEHNRIFDLNIEAEKIHAEALLLRKEQENYVKKTNEELELRETSITNYEFTLQAKNEQLDLKEEELNERRIRLEDREKTLEREMKRQTNGK